MSGEEFPLVATDQNPVCGEPAPPPVALFVEQYAHDVLDFSSQYGSDEAYSYIARNCLGKPQLFPSYGKEIT